MQNKKNPIITIIRRILRPIGPRLGVLHQYKPKPFKIPKAYYKKITHEILPTLSIVTPSFKQGDFIERTLLSVFNQHYPNLQYVVQDGGSKDGTVDILKKYADQFLYWESLPDKGQSNAINLGFKHTSGEIMAYLNSDDLLLPGALHYIGKFFAENPHVDVVYGHRVLIDDKDKEIGRWILPPHNNDILTYTDFIPQETLFWRRSIWEKVGGIDEQFQFAMDWDLLLRFRDAGAKFKRLPRFIGAFRVHPQQKTLSLISETGRKEIHYLEERYRKQGACFDKLKKQTNWYLKLNMLYQQLYRFGLLRH